LTTSKNKKTKNLTLNPFFFKRSGAPLLPKEQKKPERAGAAASLPSPVYRGRPPLPFDFLLPFSSRQQTHSPLSFKTKPEQPLRSPKPQIFPLSPEKPVKPRTRRYPQTIPTFPPAKHHFLSFSSPDRFFPLNTEQLFPHQQPRTSSPSLSSSDPDPPRRRPSPVSADPSASFNQQRAPTAAATTRRGDHPFLRLNTASNLSHLHCSSSSRR